MGEHYSIPDVQVFKFRHVNRPGRGPTECSCENYVEIKQAQKITIQVDAKTLADLVIGAKQWTLNLLTSLHLEGPYDNVPYLSKTFKAQAIETFTIEPGPAYMKMTIDCDGKHRADVIVKVLMWF